MFDGRRLGEGSISLYTIAYSSTVLVLLALLLITPAAKAPFRQTERRHVLALQRHRAGGPGRTALSGWLQMSVHVGDLSATTPTTADSGLRNDRSGLRVRP